MVLKLFLRVAKSRKFKFLVAARPFNDALVKFNIVLKARAAQVAAQRSQSGRMWPLGRTFSITALQFTVHTNNEIAILVLFLTISGEKEKI